MKKTSLLALCLLSAFFGMAQVEYVYDFNSLTEGSQNLNGQDSSRGAAMCFPRSA